MSQIDSLRMQMYFRSSLLSTQNLKEATTWNTSTCLQARSKELKCYCCCIFVSIHDSSCWYVPFYMHCSKFSVLSFCRRRELILHNATMVTPWNNVWGGVYKRKLAQSQTGMTFWFRITFTWWLGHFISRYLKVHFMLIKCTCDSKSQTLRMRYPFPSTGRPISYRVYMIPLRDFVTEWNSRPGTRTGVNLRRHDILWWYHVNKYRAMRGNRSELAPKRKSPRCHVNTPWETNAEILY